MAAAGDDRPLAGLGGDPDEHGLEAECAEAQAHLIILGHARPGERPPVLHRGEAAEGAAFDGAADAGQRDCGADRLAHDQLLHVRLGELVAIMAADPPRMGVGKRHDGQLDHRRAADQSVKDAELETMNDVLGVVEHDRFGLTVAPRFIGDERIV